MTTDKTLTLLAKLELAVLDVQDSDTFKAYLRMAAKFHKYSFGNILLIASQRPEATRVAGFRTWQALGRFVRRGEKGIAIVVPFRSLRDNDEGEVEERVRFGAGYVFDVSQTEGPDLPEVEVPLLTGDGGAAGFWQLATRTIWIAPGLSTDQAAKTFAHELAHAFDPESATYAEWRGEREAVAEAVAFVVCERYGLDTSARSVPYIAGWSQDAATLKRALGKVQTVAHEIIRRLEPGAARDAAA